MGLGIDGRGAGVAVDAPCGRFDRNVAVHDLDAREVVGGDGGVLTTDTGTAQTAYADGGPGRGRTGAVGAVEAVHDATFSLGLG
jgi:hypothetical protein